MTDNPGVPDVDVERVKAGYAAANDGDVEGMLEHWHADIVVHDASRPDPNEADGEWRGHDGVRRYFADWQESFEESRAELRDVAPAGDRVLVAVHTSARGRGSGIPIENERFHVFTMRGGIVVRFAVYADETEARAAAGL